MSFKLIVFVVLCDHSRDNLTNFQVIWNLFEYTYSFTLCYADTTRINVFWCMTRGNPSDLQPIDPEIDRTFHRGVRHNRNLFVHHAYSVTFLDSPNTPVSVHSNHFEHIMHTENSDHFDIYFETDNMAQPPPQERTMSELTTPEFTYDSLLIQYP